MSDDQAMKSRQKKYFKKKEVEDCHSQTYPVTFKKMAGKAEDSEEEMYA